MLYVKQYFTQQPLLLITVNNNTSRNKQAKR